MKEIFREFLSKFRKRVRPDLRYLKSFSKDLTWPNLDGDF